MPRGEERRGEDKRRKRKPPKPPLGRGAVFSFKASPVSEPEPEGWGGQPERRGWVHIYPETLSFCPAFEGFPCP